MHVSSRRMAWRVASTVVGMLLLLLPPSEHDNTLVISEVRAKKMHVTSSVCGPVTRKSNNFFVWFSKREGTDKSRRLCQGCGQLLLEMLVLGQEVGVALLEGCLLVLGLGHELLHLALLVRSFLKNKMDIF